MPTKPPAKGLQTLPDKKGKIKNCTPGKSFPCGKACLGIGTAIGEQCLKGLKATEAQKAKDLAKSIGKKKATNTANTTAKTSSKNVEGGKNNGEKREKGKLDKPNNNTTTVTKTPKNGNKSNDIEQFQLPDPGITPMPKGLEILHTTVPKSLGIPGTSISRIEMLARASKEGSKAIAYMFEDENLLTHLGSANSTKDKGGLNAKYAEAANKLADEAWKGLSPKDKDSIVKTLFSSGGMSKKELQSISGKSSSPIARSIAKDMISLHEKQEEEEGKEREREEKQKREKEKQNPKSSKSSKGAGSGGDNGGDDFSDLESLL